ncbi:beta-1,4-mannosyl-glycoprotein 4-beta-N-acetylglucosaminyltransferase a [Hoplias malabaricus]|uniref:beta-1,4-mannosyl-glycoprotein 4-beta-N-acetylglucosaminyltransferase a n=1 Tax=Hoplias malabaricus TaxID=27720 RepID=UPI003461C70C
MKVRRHKLFLFCSVGISVVSLLYCYKSLQQVPFLQDDQSSLKSLFMFTDVFWGAPQTSSLHNTHNHHRAEQILRQVKHDGKESKVENLVGSDSTDLDGELHKKTYVLEEDLTPYFLHTDTGELCFSEGTRTVKQSNASESEDAKSKLELHKKNNTILVGHTVKERKVVKCVCHQGWHGPNCGVPTVVEHSNLPTKTSLKPRKVPRRIINAININHEFDLLHVRFRELADTVDLFMICESNFTAYGDPKPLTFRHLLLNGTFDYIKHKILYIFLDHFPQGGRANGWIADDYLRTFLTKNGLLRVQNLRQDDVFILDDADEIPFRDGILFLKLYNGWTEPFGIHMRKSLYGFFWKQFGTLDVISGCTVAMLLMVYKGDGILLRRREYFNMPGFRQYENKSGRRLMPWSIGSPVHYAGWHCSWCFKPEGIYYKLIAAQNGDFPRWGDFAEKRKLDYIRELIRTGGWFDDSLPRYPPTDPKEPMFAPKYLLDNYDRYRYLLENPYAKR